MGLTQAAWAALKAIVAPAWRPFTSMGAAQCLVCKGPLRRNNDRQRVKYHAECRHKRHDLAFDHRAY